MNGQVVGIWKHRRSRQRPEVEIEPFGRLPVWARTGVEAEAERLAAFFASPLDISWSS